MSKPLRVLIVEDSEDDALLVIRALKKGGYEPVYKRVETAETMYAALRKKPWDVILCDYQMPRFNGLAAIALLKETGIDIPLIMVSGVIGENTAVECMRLGARDYVMKDNLSRLVPAVERELGEAKSRIQHKQTDEALQRSEQKYRLLVESTNEAIVVVQDGRAKFVNRGLEWAGYTREEYLSIPIMETVYPEDREAVEQRYLKKINGDTTPTRYTYRGMDKSGRIHWMEVSSVLIDWEGRPATLNLIADITESKRAAEEIVQLREDWENIFQGIGHPTVILDPQYGIIAANKAVVRASGLSQTELLGKKCYEVFHGKDTASPPKSCPMESLLASGKTETVTREVEAFGGVFLASCTPIQNKHGQAEKIIHVTTDITDRKQAEEALRESEERYRTIIENIEDGYFEVDIAGNFTFFNDSVCRMAGYTRAELMGMNNRQYTDKENRQILYQAFNKVFRTGEPSKGVAYEIIGKDKTRLYIESSVSLIRNTSGQPIGFRGIMRNITERKQAEEAITLAKEDWESTFSTITDMVTVHDMDFNIIRANPAAKSMFGLQLEEGIPLVKCFRCYHGTETPPSGCASCQSIQTGKTSVIEMFEPYLNRHLEIRAMPRFGSDHQMVGLIHIVRDITERKQTEEKLQETLESLRKSFAATIQVMVSAVESRDPYTSGHQTRSANLARVIATEMGLPQEKIEGLRMAGSIHDIGKLSIPAEILSKPTKLTNLEFSLIKEHASKGFEMLKDVESPWPLAQIVYQHHERMDGSGYPRNLKGEEILMEARILAVADVVEAMASHRPYRPGLGIDAALNEIEKNRGIFYDEAVVDACLRLFREKGFQLEGT